jgi:hypothetical protein
MYSLALTIFVVSEKKAIEYFPIGSNVNLCPAKLPRNDHWKVLYKFSVFYADRRSKMAATTGHSINTGPYGENTEICSLKLFHCLNLNCASIIGGSFTNCVFYVDQNSKMTTTAGHRTNWFFS